MNVGEHEAVSGRRPRPVLAMTAVLAGLQFLAGSAALADYVGRDTYGIFALGVGALQIGWGVYVQSAVTPLADPRNRAGERLTP